MRHIFQVESVALPKEQIVSDASSGHFRRAARRQANWSIAGGGPLHGNLLAGKNGRKAVGIAGIVLFVLGASGILMWLVGARNWRAWISVRRSGSTRRFNL